MTDYKKISFAMTIPGMQDPKPPAETRKTCSLTGQELSACDQIMAMMQSAGIRCGLFNIAGQYQEGDLVFCSTEDSDCRHCRTHLSTLVDSIVNGGLNDSSEPLCCNKGHNLLAVPVQREQKTVAVVIGCLQDADNSKATEALTNANHLPNGDLDDITFPSQLKHPQQGQTRGSRTAVLLQNLLKTTLDDILTQNHQNEEIDSLTDRLVQSYQELSLLHRTNDRMRISRNPQSFFNELCEELRTNIHARWVMLLSGQSPDADNDETEFTISSCAGREAPNELLARLIWDRTVHHTDRGQGVLIDSTLEARGTWTWPEPLETIISVPIFADNRLMGVLTALNKEDRQDFTATDIKLLMSLAGTSAMFHHNFKLYHDLQGLLIGSLRALTSSIDAKDRYTCGHSERVAWIAHGLAQQMNLSDEEVKTIYLAGLLHDVGKIGVPESILRKPGRLEAHEFQEIKKHPLIGAGILQDIPQMTMVNQAVRSHHERYDGKGYPEGLSGKDIPLIGRIIQLADAFDAMISRRVYRRDLPAAAAIAEIRRYSGTQFDPDIAEVFLSHAPRTSCVGTGTRCQPDRSEHTGGPEFLK